MKLLSLPTPIFDRVLVRAFDPDSHSRGGVIIPQSARKKQDTPSRGEVVATGPGSGLIPMSVAIGDSILFFDRAAIEIDVDGETLYLIPEAEVLLKY
jgi:chaperonin GroES